MENVRTYTEQGLVSEFIGTKGKIGYTPENLVKDDVLVKLTLLADDGKTLRDAFLSWELSKQLRNKQIRLGNVPTFNMSIDDRGVYIIHREKAETKWVDAKALKIEKVVKVEITDDELIVL